MIGAKLKNLFSSTIAHIKVLHYLVVDILSSAASLTVKVLFPLKYTFTLREVFYVGLVYCAE